MPWETIATLAGATLVAEALRSHLTLRRALDARADPTPLLRYPTLTVVRPVKGLDAGLEENVRAALQHGYRGQVEVLFVLDDPEEPARPVIERGIAQHQGHGGRTARLVYCGPPPPYRTGKLNAMIVAYRQVQTELVAFIDSDTRPGPDALNVLVETLESQPDAGAAFAPVVMAEPPRTIGDAGYALLLNGLYGPEAAATTRRHHGELPFIMGQCMVLRRSAIAAIGGLECAEGQLVDDMYLGACIHAAGLRNLVAPERVPIIQSGLGLRAFWRLYVRWLAFSRSGLPGVGFKSGAYVRCAAFLLGLALAAAALVAAWPWAGGLGLAAAGGVAWSMLRLHARLGGAAVPLRLRWVAAALILAGPVVLATSLLQREVEWRGRRYRLDAASRLATKRPLSAEVPVSSSEGHGPSPARRRPEPAVSEHRVAP